MPLCRRRSWRVTLPALNRAVRQVRTELAAVGLWTTKVSAVDVWLSPVSLRAYGWQHYGTTKDIVIPSVTLVSLLSGYRPSLVDVVRHEYGHVVADVHRGLIRSSRFTRAFRGAHGSSVALPFQREGYVTAYAASSPAEDFAETFMVYLRHGGRLPARFDTPFIRAKWTFIRELCGRVRAGHRRWPPEGAQRTCRRLAS